MVQTSNNYIGVTETLVQSVYHLRASINDLFKDSLVLKGF